MTRFSILARERASGNAVDLKDFTLREEGSADATQLLTRRDLSLYCLDIDSKKAAFVSTPPEIDLEAAPFYYGAQFQHAQELFTVDLDIFRELAAQIPPAENLIFVHNIGRCGSTLLSKAFSQLDSCTSYSEPDCFTQIAFWRTVNDPRDDLWRALLAACMNFVFRDAH